MSENATVSLSLRQVQDYRCEVRFGDGAPMLITDEPPPVGSGQGPSPVQLLLTAVANCLLDSLLFALRKFKQQAEPLQCDAIAEIGRNAQGRLRVLAIEVRLQLSKPAQQLMHLPRILGQFEAFCTVSQSVALGIPVHVQVSDSTGRVLQGSDIHEQA